MKHSVREAENPNARVVNEVALRCPMTSLQTISGNNQAKGSQRYQQV